MKATAIMMDTDLVTAVKAYAKAKDISVSDLARQAIATMINFDLKPMAPKTKYASKEERDAAMKAAAKARRDLDNQILKAVSEGRMDVAKRLMNDRTKRAVKASKKAGEVKTTTPAAK